MESDFITSEQKGKVTLVTLKINNVIHDDNEHMVKAFDDLLNAGHTTIVLDLTPTNYVSSLILASFVYVQQKARAAGGDLVLASVKNRVLEILTATNLDKVFKITATVDEAIKFVSKG